MNHDYSDKSHIILSSEQWNQRVNQYKVIDEGVLCIEIQTPELMLIKIGVGNKFYKDLPYIHGGDGSEIDLSSYAKIKYVDDKFELYATTTYVDNALLLIKEDISSLIKISHTHSNKSILDKIDVLYTNDDQVKLHNIEDNANNYKLPIASKIELGGIKIGDNIEISDDGTLSVSITDIDTMTGASDEEDGKSGIVPTPLMGDNIKYLRGDGTWEIPDDTQYNVFDGASYPYEETDEETGEVIDYFDGEGTVGLVPAPPSRNIEMENKYGNMYLRYDGIWSYLPTANIFTAPDIYNPGEKGLVPAPDLQQGDYILTGDSKWITPSDMNYDGRYIRNGFENEFKLQTVYTIYSKNFIIPIRNNDEDNTTHAPTGGSGIAFGMDDSFGYIYMDPINERAILGGGNDNALNWIKDISFTDHTHPIDVELSLTSENPVQNKTITNVLANMPKLKFSSISDFPEIGNGETLYIATDDTQNNIYRWDDTVIKYVLLTGGVYDYDLLTNLPKLNDITISGNKTNEEYGVNELSNWDIENILTD